jgi:hypothetical protein
MDNKIYIFLLIVIIVFTGLLASFNNVENFSVTYCNKEDFPTNTNIGCFKYTPASTTTVKNISSGSAKSFRVKPGFGVTPYTSSNCTSGRISKYINGANSDMTIGFAKLKQDANTVPNFSTNGVKCIQVTNSATDTIA